jgi:viologen exporter family transport system permease protein
LRLQASGFGDVLSGVVFLAWSHSVSWRAAPLALLAIVTSALVFVACGILFQSLAFWMGNIDTVARQLWEPLVTFAVYPEPLFGGTLRLILFTVLPAGFVGYVPARLAERPSGALALLMISAAAAYLALAAVVFERGLKRYTSGSLFGVHG